MFVIIVGAGRVGWQLARQLVSEEKEVTLIERDPDLVRRAAERLDCQVVAGEGNNVSVLSRAGIGQADFFVATTESDEINMIACGLVAAEYKEIETIARVRNIAYSTSRMVRKRVYGIDHIINPEVEVASAVIRSLKSGVVGTVSQFSESGLSMTSINIDPGSSLDNRMVKNIRQDMSVEFLLPIIIRDGKSLIPAGDTKIQSHDIIYVIANIEGTEQIVAASGLKRRNIRRVAIAGGGRISRYVADYLLSTEDSAQNISGKSRSKTNWHFRRQTPRYHVHFIESDYRIARSLCEDYPAALITNADISDEEVTETGILDDCDLLVSATGNQELNLVSALHAKNHGVSKTISLVRRASYVNMAIEMGLDVALSVTDTMVDSILSILRKGNIRSIHSIAGSDFEVIDLLIDEESRVMGHSISQLKLPRNSLVLIVNRKGEYLLPYGSLILNHGDRLIVICPRKSVKQLEQVIVHL